MAAAGWRAERMTAWARTGAQRLIAPLIALAIWHFASTAGWVDARFVPAPATVLRTLNVWTFGPPGDAYSGTWYLHAASSAYRVLVGFLIAAARGILIGSLIGWFRLVSDLLYPIIQVLRPIPISAWVPFAVMFFGIGDGSAFFLM